MTTAYQTLTVNSYMSEVEFIQTNPISWDVNIDGEFVGCLECYETYEFEVGWDRMLSFTSGQLKAIACKLEELNANKR